MTAIRCTGHRGPSYKKVAEASRKHLINTGSTIRRSTRAHHSESIQRHHVKWYVTAICVTTNTDVILTECSIIQTQSTQDMKDVVTL